MTPKIETIKHINFSGKIYLEITTLNGMWHGLTKWFHGDDETIDEFISCKESLDHGIRLRFKYSK